MDLSNNDKKLINSNQAAIENLDFTKIKSSRAKVRLCQLLAQADIYPFSVFKDISENDWEWCFVDATGAMTTAFDPLLNVTEKLETDPVRINAMLKVMYILGYGIWTIRGIDLSDSSVAMSTKYAITEDRDDDTPEGYFDALIDIDFDFQSLTPAMFGLQGNSNDDWGEDGFDPIYDNWEKYATKVNYTKQQLADPNYNVVK